MKGINKVIIVGTLGKNPEVRQMDSGNTVANISVAVTEKYKDKQNQPQELTEWINVVFFGKVADIVAEYCVKGSQIYVEGKMKTEKYEKNGQTLYSTKVVGKEMQLLGNRSAESGRKGGQATAAAAKDADFDDTILF